MKNDSENKVIIENIYNYKFVNDANCFDVVSFCYNYGSLLKLDGFNIDNHYSLVEIFKELLNREDPEGKCQFETKINNINQLSSHGYKDAPFDYWLKKENIFIYIFIL